MTTPGPLGVPLGPALSALRLPPRPLPTAAGRWGFRAMGPPYREWGPPIPADRLQGAVRRLPRGAVLLATPLDAGADAVVSVADWMRTEFPWTAQVMALRGDERVAAVEALAIRLSRRGLGVVSRPSPDPEAVAELVLRSADPMVELPGALEAMVPRWEPTSRILASGELRAGVGATLEVEATLQERAGRNRRVLFRAGRALGAALAIQRATDTPFSAVATQVGFGSEDSLSNALQNLMGVHPWDVEGTVGWRWLLWLFLAGAGRGRRVAYRYSVSPQYGAEQEG